MKKKTVILSSYLLISLIIMPLLFRILIEVLRISPNNSNKVASLMRNENLIVYLIISVVLLVVMNSEIITDFKTYIHYDGKIPQALFVTFIYILSTVLGIFLLSFFVVLIPNSGKPEFDLGEIIILLGIESDPIYALTMIIIMPFINSVIFGKIAINLFVKDLKINEGLAILITSLIFALVSIGLNPKYGLATLIIAIPYIFQGFILGYIYAKYEHNIYPAIVAQILTAIFSQILIYNLF